jgi:Helicase HerA, central domain
MPPRGVSCNTPLDIAGIHWFRLYFPHELDVEMATRLFRPLASRPRLGLTRRTPAVIFELWSLGGDLRWLLGADEQLVPHLMEQLRAQLPGLAVEREPAPSRPEPHATRDLRVDGGVQPLRLDTASSVAAGLHEALRLVHTDESAVLQWIIGPSEQRRVTPSRPSLTQLLGFNAMKPPVSDRLQWRQKTSEPLFAVRGRVGARTSTLDRSHAFTLMLAQAEALANASHSEVRSSAALRGARALIRPSSLQWWSGVLNAAELAVLLGFPVGGLPVEGTSPYPAPRQLVATANQAAAGQGMKTLGHSLHPVDRQQLVVLPTSSALHHLHITGVTGSGKSTALASLLRADISAGRGVLLIDPRGDLINDVLAGVPSTRRDDVVVIEPGIESMVVGFNPLAGGRKGAERRADQVLQLFRQVFGKSIGPRSHDVLLHALTALARSSQGTLADLPVLLTNRSFRRRLLAEVTDELVLAPFFAWYDGLSGAEQAQVIAPVLNKTRTFLSRPAIRRLLGQASPRFRVEDVFSHRRIVLVNLNPGIIGPETASLIGALLLGELWQATLRRASLPPHERHPVTVAVDEVQNFLKLPVDIGEMLAQSRALGVALVLAHQHLGQLTPGLKAAFIANARSRMVFQPSTEDIRPLTHALGLHSPNHLEHLGRFEACCRVVVNNMASLPFTVRTTPLGAPSSDPAALRAACQLRYGVAGDDLDAALTDRWHPPAPDAPIGTTRRAA